MKELILCILFLSSPILLADEHVEQYVPASEREKVSLENMMLEEKKRILREKHLKDETFIGNSLETKRDIVEDEFESDQNEGDNRAPAAAVQGNNQNQQKQQTNQKQGQNKPVSPEEKEQDEFAEKYPDLVDTARDRAIRQREKSDIKKAERLKEIFNQRKESQERQNYMQNKELFLRQFKKPQPVMQAPVQQKKKK